MHQWWLLLMCAEGPGFGARRGTEAILLHAHEHKLTDNVKCDIVRRYFPETDDTNNWISYPFHALPPGHLPIYEQESH